MLVVERGDVLEGHHQPAADGDQQRVVRELVTSIGTRATTGCIQDVEEDYTRTPC